MARTIKRILVYTHNSIGMGHAFRTLAVITGIKRHRPDIDFLVLSGSSIPHLFLSHGIEVVKLPGIKKEVDKPGSPLLPRYLTTLEASAVFAYRQRVILDTFEFFSPDVVMVEHYMGGLMDEVLPLIGKKRSEEALPREWALVHLSRGICPTFDPRASRDISVAAEAARKFDLIYVFEDPGKADSNHELLEEIPELRRKTRYPGPIAVRPLHELPSRREVVRRFGLPDKRIILITLGRHGPVLRMTGAILAALRRRCLSRDCHIVMTVDPYLEQEVAGAIERNGLNEGAQVLHFTPHLIDLVNIADLVICRAGYNMINEVLMTGASSLVIPECHPGAEQERRAGSIERENVKVVDENEILNGSPQTILDDLLSREGKPSGINFDKYAIGRSMLHDLEELLLREPRERSPGKENGRSSPRDIP